MDATTAQKPDSMVSMTAPKAAPDAKSSGTIRSVRVEPADGGFIVNIDRESGDGGMGSMPKPHVCKDAAELHAYIDEALGLAAAPEPAPAMEDENIRMDAYEAPEPSSQFRG